MGGQMSALSGRPGGGQRSNNVVERALTLFFAGKRLFFTTFNGKDSLCFNPFSWIREKKLVFLVLNILLIWINR